jgi:hypothetical protein
VILAIVSVLPPLWRCTHAAPALAGYGHNAHGGKLTDFDAVCCDVAAQALCGGKLDRNPAWQLDLRCR